MDLEKSNRDNFRAMMNSLSMPSKIQKIKPLYNSNLLAIASVLLYNETSFFYDGIEDISIIEAITNTKKDTAQNADYIFSDTLDVELIEKVKKGDFINPDFSATLIFTCKDFDKTRVILSGAGIDGKKEMFLPCSRDFIKALREKNSEYPLGVEVFFINSSSEAIALSRTTNIELI